MIVVLVEHDGNEVLDLSLETITFARSLSEAGGGIAIRAVAVGTPSETSLEQLRAAGVAEVHTLGGEAYDAYSGAAWAQGTLEVVRETGSVVVLGAGSPRGNEVLAHLATQAGVAFAASVVSFNSLGPFVVNRQVVGGLALEEMDLKARPAVLSIAGHSWPATPADTPGAGTVVERTPAVDPKYLIARVAETGVKEVDQSGSLKSARVVVGAGRGAGGPDGFSGVDELASLIGAQVGVSRVVTSLGWRPHHEQVGQTGSQIMPDLYMPCGISGAIQHWAGCASSKAILAVNTDDEAPMMTRATYAVVGDMHEVVPAVIEEIQSRGLKPV